MSSLGGFPLQWVALGIYLLSCVVYWVALFSEGGNSERLAGWIAGLGWLVHLVAIVLRWVGSGVHSAPWLSFFEALGFLSWWIVGAYLYSQMRFKVRWAGGLPTFVAAVALLMGELQQFQGKVAPGPSFQSFWLYLHPPLVFLAYGFFFAAGAFSFFFLVQEKLKTDTLLTGASLIFSLMLPFAFGEGFFRDFQFSFDLVTRDLDGAMRVMSAQSAVVPYANWAAQLALGAMLLHALLGTVAERKIPMSEHQLEAGFLGYFEEKTDRLRFFLRAVFVIGVVCLWALLALLIWANWFVPGFKLMSNPYRFFGMLLPAFLGAVMLGVMRWRDLLSEKLPKSARFDRFAYQSVLSGFAFLTLGIVSGAIWAHQAWGRPWGWDVKEIWALATWIIYAIYLHIRMIHQQDGHSPTQDNRRAAVIAIVALGLVIFTFVSVNFVGASLHRFASQ